MSKLVAHLTGAKPAGYAFADSLSGIREAAARGYPATDVDVRTCRADNWTPLAPWRRRIVAVHWARWWEHGFEPRPGEHVPRRRIERLRLAQVQALRAKSGHYGIATAEAVLRKAHEHKIVPCLELKPSRWPSAVLRALVRYAAAYGYPFVTMTIQSYGHTARARRRWENGAYTRMRRAHGAGALTMLLYREPVDWQRWAPVLDAIKGHPGHGRVVSVGKLLERLR